jgi:hypothetical protein
MLAGVEALMMEVVSAPKPHSGGNYVIYFKRAKK